MHVSLPTLPLTFCVLFGRAGYWTQILEALTCHTHAAPPSSSLSLFTLVPVGVSYGGGQTSQ